MSRDIPCNEPNCPEIIHYKRDITVAQLRISTSQYVVYLTCDCGHTNRYEINLEQYDDNR